MNFEGDTTQSLAEGNSQIPADLHVPSLSPGLLPSTRLDSAPSQRQCYVYGAMGAPGTPVVGQSKPAVNFVLKPLRCQELLLQQTLAHPD